MRMYSNGKLLLTISYLICNLIVEDRKMNDTNSFIKPPLNQTSSNLKL